jgi:hypothetical protein
MLATTTTARQGIERNRAEESIANRVEGRKEADDGDHSITDGLYERG